MTQTSTPTTEPTSDDPMIERIIEALETIRREEFDYEILTAASEVLGHDAVTSWRPSLSYLPPERQGDEYHVTVYAKGACESCPVKRFHVGSIEPKLRQMVGSDNIVVHDYFDMWDWQTTPQWGDG